MRQMIIHRGTVESVNGSHVSVRITQLAACSACAARRLCNSSESKEKKIDVATPDAASFSSGEEVVLAGRLSLGLQAVLWAYFVPLVLLVAVLFVAIDVTGSEPGGALAAVGGLALYYGLLYLNRDRLARKFSFTIKHIKHIKEEIL